MEIGSMTIEAAVSDFPREIRIPVCPKCGHFIYLFHSERKPDPFIGAKVLLRVLAEKNIPPRTWLTTCWTDDCDFYLTFKEEDLAKCPECNLWFMEYYTLYDHMKFQCTETARDNNRIREAGAGMYISDLVALEFKADDDENNGKSEED